MSACAARPRITEGHALLSSTLSASTISNIESVSEARRLPVTAAFKPAKDMADGARRMFLADRLPMPEQRRSIGLS